jgi:hypothetical protein
VTPGGPETAVSREDEARENYACPHCTVEAGNPCLPVKRTRRNGPRVPVIHGRPLLGVHPERLALVPVVQFERWQKVRINYPNAPYRIGHVERDDGGPKVLVSWRSQDGPKVGRNVVAWHGATHEQWFPRERLERQ